MEKRTINGQISLVSSPWPVFNRPSIQLGALKAYLKKQLPQLDVVAHHFFLQVAETIGYDVYRRLSERTWIAESIYAALLNPEHFEKAEKLFQKQTRKLPKIHSLNFENLVRHVEKASEKFITKTDWRRFDLVGFSVCLCQLTSSLYLMRKIKSRCSDTMLVAGGSLMTASAARSMLDVFPQIDAIIVGEGEKPLVSLVKNLQQVGDLAMLSPVDSVVTRYSSKDPERFSQVQNLSEIPRPDYREYFELLNRFAPEKKFFPVLPMEISRGCWWRSAKGTGEEKGCAFCNLNLQWKGYRTKPPEKVISEVDEMTSQHGLLSVAFMDNVIPPKHSTDLFQGLSGCKKDFRFFCELRASVEKDELSTLRNAGVTEVQVGIEALSTSLLKKIRKGTTAIQNIEIMKHCEALSIKDTSNLLICFPGSDQKDVEETLRSITFVQPFRPLKIVSFWLGMGSPVYQKPKDFGIKDVFNHPNYRALFPKKIVEKVRFIIQDYRGDKAYQRKLWLPVKKAVSEWKKNYGKLHENAGSGPVLSYRDGGDFMIIRERRIKGDHQNHRLSGMSRAIYLFCDHTRSIGEIADYFQMVQKDNIMAFLTMMTQKKLMFEENNRFLSLAVRER